MSRRRVTANSVRPNHPLPSSPSGDGLDGAREAPSVQNACYTANEARYSSFWPVRPLLAPPALHSPPQSVPQSSAREYVRSFCGNLYFSLKLAPPSPHPRCSFPRPPAIAQVAIPGFYESQDVDEK
ncbi:hypothetical protein GLOTRDRAFT_134226 [Gloeophyllum trabeum ATCC 11539]|uniref:Uncharacterized protein n=1 Tax=Gloeophyllum trabeum (strain ATCC 11539 / FP-39264 / Madison 617) TaxID=670483 RepID=S7PRX0_GLOTA|nr:uncharacterized protein GLOTRDRAFT_134226 [Gloeophyllum trabeum ATCC 11539]EPQ50133.1 hypothetical protein GLOTRDRAFT_134226 [Gloeophyllum trabeum ATCC 11539]